MDLAPDPSRVRRLDGSRSTGTRAIVVSLGLALGLGGPEAGVLADDKPGSTPSPTTSEKDPKARAQVASAPGANPESHRVLDVNHAGAGAAESEPIARARQMIADCGARYQSVNDYTCTFFKRERVDGKLYDAHVILMKARTHPSSLYFKFIEPNKGREAIYVHGRNNGKIIAHEVGFGRVVAGTMHLDPKGSMAMEENRHPVTEAGIGSLIDNVKHHWAMELTPANAHFVLLPNAKVGDRPCTLIEATHPKRGPQFLFHKVKLYIDKELNLPIRFEAYDWPSRPGHEPLLIEEYTYINLKLNVGLKERDFDPSNSQYSYGRF